MEAPQRHWRNRLSFIMTITGPNPCFSWRKINALKACSEQTQTLGETWGKDSEPEAVQLENCGPRVRGGNQGLDTIRGSRMCVCLVAQSCSTLCNLMDCGPPGSSVRGILQARILEWVAMPSSRGASQHRD